MNQTILSLTGDQAQALQKIKYFLQNDELDCFILRGSAGTGKTTLIAKLIKEVRAMHIPFALAATTGRGARVLQNKIEQIIGNDGEIDPACRTIHGHIYSDPEVKVVEQVEDHNDPGIRMFFPLKTECPAFSLLIVDEASMIGDCSGNHDSIRFGSGRVLKDLLEYARIRRSGRGADRVAKIIFVGDAMQLPPVGETGSPALFEEYLLQEFAVQADSYEMSEVTRQAQDSAILNRATELRNALAEKQFNTFSLRPDQQEICQVEICTALDAMIDAFENRRSAVTVVHANAAALKYNRSIRERLWGCADLPVQESDTLLVNRNSTVYKELNNGDLVRVTAVADQSESEDISLRGKRQVCLSFRKVSVETMGIDGKKVIIPCMILENLLNSPERELSPLEQQALIVHFSKRHKHLKQGSEEFAQALLGDPYFNALQVKYGYAMTCHKAQGGEWDTVILDFTTTRGQRNEEFFRWSYTAITRAAKKLMVVNPPNFTAVSDMAWRDTVPAEVSANIASCNEDPDWHRLSFSVATAPLLGTHQKLRDWWQARGIRIERLQHLQYCERYTLVRNGQYVTAEYFYNGKYRPSRTRIAEHPMMNQQLAADALSALHAIGSITTVEEEQPDEFIRNFLEQLDAALASSPIRRTAIKVMPYRLRITLSDGTRSGQIDFSHNAAKTWTTSQEVGAAGSSNGLYQELKCLLHRQGE